MKAAHETAMATLRAELEEEKEQALLEAAEQQKNALQQLEEQLKVLPSLNYHHSATVTISSITLFLPLLPSRPSMPVRWL